MAEINDDKPFVIPTIWNEVNPEAWSDVYDLKTISLSSIDIKCADISEKADQTKVNCEHYFPPELMEKIVCHLDGRTLLKFKLLSKACNVIVNNALQHNRLWKKICLNEIPKKYMGDMFDKYFEETFVSFDSLSEEQYEKTYKNWLQWQSDIFNTTIVGEHNFFHQNEIEKIICDRFNVKIVFSNYTKWCSLEKNRTGGHRIVEKYTEDDCEKPRVVTINHLIINKNYEVFNVYAIQPHFGKNNFPLHFNSTFEELEIDMDVCTFKVIDVDFNIYLNACCWILEPLYGHCFNLYPTIKNIPRFKILFTTMYISVAHHVIISSVSTNSIVIHDMLKKSNTTIYSWLKQKYTVATAVYIYANTLFIGSKNGYLLAYRLRCWDDLINLKDENLLMETRLAIGRIKQLNVIDFENFRAIVVASYNTINCIKIN